MFDFKILCVYMCEIFERFSLINYYLVEIMGKRNIVGREFCVLFWSCYGVVVVNLIVCLDWNKFFCFVLIIVVVVVVVVFNG